MELHARMFGGAVYFGEDLSDDDGRVDADAIYAERYEIFCARGMRELRGEPIHCGLVRVHLNNLRDVADLLAVGFRKGVAIDSFSVSVTFAVPRLVC